MLTQYDLHHRITQVNYMFSLSFCHWSGKRLLCFWIYLIFILFILQWTFCVVKFMKVLTNIFEGTAPGRRFNICFCRCLIIFKLLRWSCNFTVVKINRLLFPFHEGYMEKLCKFTYMFFDCVQFQSSTQYTIVNLFCIRMFKRKELCVYFSMPKCNLVYQENMDVFL